MVRGGMLTAYEKGQIDAMSLEGGSAESEREREREGCSGGLYWDITWKTRQYTTLENLLDFLSERARKHITIAVANSSLNCAVVTRERALDGRRASRSTVWRTVNRSENFVRSKMATAPSRAATHKVRRLSFVREHMARLGQGNPNSSKEFNC